MLYEERRDLILQIINEKKYTNVMELAEKLHFSESTIRRDLKKLEQERMVYCSHGGITSNIHPNMETPLQLRLSTNRKNKSIIARRAAEMVEDNMIVMMDLIPVLRIFMRMMARISDTMIAIAAVTRAFSSQKKRNIATAGRKLNGYVAKEPFSMFFQVSSCISTSRMPRMSAPTGA